MATVAFSVTTFSQTVVPSTIKAVTVYRSGATVERGAKVNLPVGKQILHFIGLPKGLNQSTMRLELPSGIRLMKMEYRYLTASEKAFPQFRNLSDQINSLEGRLDEQNDLKLSLQEDLAFISVNTDLSSTAKVQDIQAADAYFSKRRREIREAIRNCLNEIESIQSESQKLRAELAIMENEMNNDLPMLEVEVEVSANAGKNYKLSYFTYQARWDPFYNVRTKGLNQPMEFEFKGAIQQNTGENWDNVSMYLSTGNPSLGATEPSLPTWFLSFNENYVPSIPYQNSPPNISMRSSFIGVVLNNETGQPMENARVDLRAGNDAYIGISDKDGKVIIENLPVRSYSMTCQYEGFNTLNSSVSITSPVSLQRMKLTTNGSSQMVSYAPVVRQADNMNFRENEEVHALASRDISEVQFIDGVQVRGTRSGYEKIQVRSNFNRVQQAVSALYVIDKPFTVPTTGEQQDVWIQSMDVDVNFIHRIRPARSDRAFLISKISDWESLELLKGNAHFFVDEVYNGTALLNPENTADTMELALGNDEEIVIDRERMDANKSQRFFSGKIDEQFHYRIKIRNTKNVAVNAIIQEQFPVSQNDNIEVSEKIAEGAQIDNQTGIITWEKKLEPNQEIILEYSFMVTYPKNTGVNLPR